MTQQTRFNGNYTIAGIDPTSNVDVSAHTLTVHGNLSVNGTMSTISTTDTAVTDNMITLNSGENGTGVSKITSGIEVDRGSLSKVAVRWNETYQKWELTNDGTIFGNIVSIVGDVPLFSVINDPNPQLGGNLDVLARSIFSSNTEYVTFSLSGQEYPGGGAGSGIAIEHTSIVPGYKPNHVVLYTQEPEGGGSGLFVTNEHAPKDELITKKKAIIYSLIM